jgi:hypothetical protein
MFDVACLSVVAGMVIARLRRGSGPIQPRVPPVIDCPPVQERSPWRELRERWLDLPRDQPGARAVVFAVALLITIAGGVISVGRYSPQAPLTARTAVGFQPVAASAGVLDFGVACTVAAWTLVISGLFLARWQVRLTGLVLLVAGAFAERHEMGGLSLFTGAPGLSAMAGIVVLGLLTLAADWRTHLGKRALDFRSPALTPVTAAVIGLLVVVAYLGQATRLGGISSAAQRSVSVLELLNITAVLILPVLLIAGADVADFGGALASGVSWSLRRRRLTVTLTAGLAATFLTLILLYLGPRVLVPALAAVPVLAIIAAAAARSRPFPRWTKPLPALVLAGILFWLLAAGQVAFGLIRTPRPVLSVSLTAVFMDPGPPVFSFRAPAACGRPQGFRASAGSAGAGAGVSNCRPLPFFSFEIWTSPGESKDPCALPSTVLHREGFSRVRYQPASRDGKWRTCAVNEIGDHQRGTAWTWSAAGRTWMAVGLTDDQAGVYQALAPLLRQMRDSERQSATPAPLPAPPHITSAARAVASAAVRAAAVWIAVAAVAGLILALRRRRDQADLALLYLTCTGAWVGLTRIGAAAAGTSMTEGAVFSRQSGGLAALAAVSTLTYLAVLAIRSLARRRQGERAGRRERFPDRLDGLLALDITLLLIWATAGLYGAASRAGSSRPVLLGVVLMLALLWELGFSGPALNPGDVTSAMPHRARVIAYSGYLILTTAAVLQLGTLRSATGAPVGIFESETLVQTGIIEFGVPLAITIFLVSWLSTPADNDPHSAHKAWPPAMTSDGAARRGAHAPHRPSNASSRPPARRHH